MCAAEHWCVSGFRLIEMALNTRVSPTRPYSVIRGVCMCVFVFVKIISNDYLAGSILNP